MRTCKATEERLTPEQLAKLFEVATRRTRVVIQIAATTGMREGEIFALRWRDVDLKARTIEVRRQYTHGEFVEHAKTDAGRRFATLLLGQVHLAQERLVARIAFEIPKERGSLQGIQTVISLRERPVQPFECGVLLLAEGVRL